MDGIRLCRIFGFEIRIDYSWFVIFFLILWSFSYGVFPSRLPGLPTGTYLLMGGAGTVLFFASLLAHELSHSLVARAKGIPVEGITLFLFGGIARTRSESESPGDELLIAGVGPLMSAALGAAFYAAAWVVEGTGLSEPVGVVSQYLGFINLVLAAFNLLPGFPLDGGRLFRALAWKWTGDLTRATRWASTGGKALGYALMVLGFFQAFSGILLGGLWLVFIGWFLRGAAEMTFRQHVLREVLDGMRAGDVMTEGPETVPPELTLEELVDRHFLRRRYQAFPVVSGDRLVGLVTLQQVKHTPRGSWATARVADVMTSDLHELRVSPDESMADVLSRLGETGAGRVLVTRNGHLEGIISGSDVVAWARRANELGGLQARRRRGQENA
jgi:Zn-dependent protease